jgi:hypothetical protein
MKSFGDHDESDLQFLPYLVHEGQPGLDHFLLSDEGEAGYSDFVCMGANFASCELKEGGVLKDSWVLMQLSALVTRVIRRRVIFSCFLYQTFRNECAEFSTSLRVTLELFPCWSSKKDRHCACHSDVCYACRACSEYPRSRQRIRYS